MKHFVFFGFVLSAFGACSSYLAENKNAVVFKENGALSLNSSGNKSKSTSGTDFTSASTVGDWCEFPAKKVFSFSCARGNPGTGWVLQPDGCYHTVTSQSCSCQLPSNWLSAVTQQCSGQDMILKDSCGYSKKLENAVACGGTGKPITETPTVSKLSCEEARFTKLINMYRQSKGMSPLSVSIAGVKASRWHAKDMMDNGYFAHSEPNGRSFNSRAAAFGFGAWAENIAAGVSDASGTFCQWKNSAGHNSNMLGNHSAMGIGNVSGGGSYGTYWNNVFGSASDIISEPLTLESGCTMPTSLPGC